MKVNSPGVSYSSIVEIGENVTKLEKSNGLEYLKLHRGVMDVDIIDINSVMEGFDYNKKSIQQYGPNDGDNNLISTIKFKFNLIDHHVLMTPGGMSSLDLVVNSLSDDNFWVPKYHWGSWNKILKIHNKNIKEFNDFNIESFKACDPLLGFSGVVLLCFPSNPTGWSPSFDELKKFLDHSKSKNITVILDLPYYYLFNGFEDRIHELYYDNVIIVSSFSKSLGLSGLRVGYIATKNEELYNSLKIRSLYKYNSISNISQKIILNLLNTNNGKMSIDNYQRKTKQNIKDNILFLSEKGLLFDEYPSIPTGPFAIIKVDYDTLLSNLITSVPLNKFSLDRTVNSNYSRISVAVPHDKFKKYFTDIKNIEILPEDIWNEEKLNKISELVKNHSNNQSEGRKIRNKLLSNQYKIEDNNNLKK